MTHTHLGPEDWETLLEGEGDPPPFTVGCDACETSLLDAIARHSDDGQVDDALLGAGPLESRPAEPDDVGFARFWRARPDARKQQRRTRTIAVTAMATVTSLATMAAAIVFIVAGPEDTTFREKGLDPLGPQAPRLALVHRQGADLVAFETGTELPVGAPLFFQVELPTEACVTLWVDEGHGPERLLDSPACLPAGGSVLERDGEALGFVPDAPGTVRLGVSDGEEAPEDWRSVRVVPPEPVQ